MKKGKEKPLKKVHSVQIVGKNKKIAKMEKVPDFGNLCYHWCREPGSNRHGKIIPTGF